MLILNAPGLQAPGLAHGFFGRPGGVSQGVYAGLNCGPGSGDLREHVLENRRRALAALGDGLHLNTLYQIHSAEAVVTDAPWEIAPKADAMATRTPGLVLGILTADCAPVLLADPAARVIGAAHAGWKGAIGGVTDAVIGAMESLGAARGRMIAAIGPCIAQISYEVDAAFRARFLAESPAHDGFFIASTRADHFRFDLEGYVAGRLAKAGIAKVEKLGADTYPDAEKFFSFRRTTHLAEPDYGRELSAIVLQP